MNRVNILTVALGFLLLSVSCERSKEIVSDINIFSIEDDKALGKQIHQEIMSDPQQYPILDPRAYPEAYNYMYKIRDRILNSGEVTYKNEFVWELYIIRDDSTLNAFVTPGGYIYVYTGLIKFLNAEHQLAGVLGHEIAHADQRHTTDMLTKIYGVQLLLAIALGNADEQEQQIANIAASLGALAYSRSKEREADEFSVHYLCPTVYQADGAAAFFEKIQEQGGGQPPTFLSTHPDPGNRVQNINQLEQQLGCTGDATFDEAYSNFKNTLP